MGSSFYFNPTQDMEELLRQCILELAKERNAQIPSAHEMEEEEQDLIADYVDSLSWNTNYFLREIARKLEEKGVKNPKDKFFDLRGPSPDRY